MWSTYKMTWMLRLVNLPYYHCDQDHPCNDFESIAARIHVASRIIQQCLPLLRQQGPGEGPGLCWPRERSTEKGLTVVVCVKEIVTILAKVHQCVRPCFWTWAYLKMYRLIVLFCWDRCRVLAMAHGTWHKVLFCPRSMLWSSFETIRACARQRRFLVIKSSTSNRSGFFVAGVQ